MHSRMYVNLQIYGIVKGKRYARYVCVCMYVCVCAKLDAIIIAYYTVPVSIYVCMLTYICMYRNTYKYV